MSPPERINRNKSFEGFQDVYTHASAVLGCTMRFAVYLPLQAVEGKPCPVVYWLSGLTCNDQNFVTKAGAQSHAAAHGLIVVAPDTSPRGDGVANDAAYDLGQGAGFYVNATRAPWSAHYRMYDYVVEELPALIDAHFPTTGAVSIMGHSMGGHGALVVALRNPGRYRAVSAFAPIVAPSEVPWGAKAFAAYLGDDAATWAPYDAVALVQQPQAGPRLPLLVDQGEDDEFLAEQLVPQRLEAVCAAVGHPLTMRRHVGYDHSYYFIASFMKDHMLHHAAALTCG